MTGLGSWTARVLAAASLSCSTACNQETQNNLQAPAGANGAVLTSPSVNQAVTSSDQCPPPLSWGAMRGTAGSPPPIDPVRNKVSIDAAGNSYWNSTPVDLVTLRQYLDLVTTMRPPPLFDLEVDPRTPCDRVARIVALVSGALDCSRLCSYAQRPFDPARVRAAAEQTSAVQQEPSQFGSMPMGSADQWRIVPDGFGPATVGMTPEQVSAALRRALSAPDIHGQCDHRSDRTTGLEFLFVGGRLYGVTNLNNERVLTANGPAEGSTEAELRAAYGSRLGTAPHSLGRVYTRFVVYGNTRETSIDFYVRNSVVEWVSSGRDGNIITCGR